jgi:hypothetical protein
MGTCLPFTTYLSRLATSANIKNPSLKRSAFLFAGFAPAAEADSHAEALAVLAQEFGQEELFLKLIDEMAKTSVENLAPDDLKGYAKFIADFADSAPKIARKRSTSCWGCLTESLLSSMPKYSFRNGCLHAIGHVFSGYPKRSERTRHSREYIQYSARKICDR